MRKNLFVAISLCGFLLNGCATVTSDQKVIANASVVTGDEIISIQNRNQVGVDTFYTATAKSGTKYNCQFNGGDVISFGIIQHSKCEKKSK
jgi:hypothetical protein